MKNIKVMLFFKNVLLLTFYQKVNEGELPQYYVMDDHEAIIDRGTFDLVQTELVKRRGMQGRTVFSSKIKCAECGCYYGAKVWHSTDKYRHIIYRCNGKYKNHCSTKVVSEEEIKTYLLKSLMNYLKTKKK